MANIPEYRNIFRYILDALENDELTRRELVDATIASFCLPDETMSDRSIGSRYLELRSSVGAIINEMTSRGIIETDVSGRYRRTEERLVAIRTEECEEEILELVHASPKSKAQIKDGLISYFGTDKTPSVKDDNRLFTYMGQILKALVAEGVFDFDGGVYSIAPERVAYIKDRAEMLSLRASFLSRIHSRGGEFFEHYFLNLFKKYLVRMGKTIVEAYVTGGSDDGGIDGIVRTIDSLGFKETVMIQTKNRTDTMSETDVRGFYGAVCAKQGSRGIFVTTSEFHPAAVKLLDSIDNCVGINGEKLFSMACDCAYGIIREGDRLKLDREII